MPQRRDGPRAFHPSPRPLVPSDRACHREGPLPGHRPTPGHCPAHHLPRVPTESLPAPREIHRGPHRRPRLRPQRSVIRPDGLLPPALRHWGAWPHSELHQGKPLAFREDRSPGTRRHHFRLAPLHRETHHSEDHLGRHPAGLLPEAPNPENLPDHSESRPPQLPGHPRETPPADPLELLRETHRLPPVEHSPGIPQGPSLPVQRHRVQLRRGQHRPVLPGNRQDQHHRALRLRGHSLPDHQRSGHRPYSPFVHPGHHHLQQRPPPLLPWAVGPHRPSPSPDHE